MRDSRGTNEINPARSQGKTKASRATKCVKRTESTKMTISMFHELTHRTLFVCHGHVRPCRLNANDHGADAGDDRPLSGGPQGPREDLRGSRNALPRCWWAEAWWTSEWAEVILFKKKKRNKKHAATGPRFYRHSLFIYAAKTSLFLRSAITH